VDTAVGRLDACEKADARDLPPKDGPINGMSSRHSGSTLAIRWLDGNPKKRDESHEFLGRQLLGDLAVAHVALADLQASTDSVFRELSPRAILRAWPELLCLLSAKKERPGEQYAGDESAHVCCIRNPVSFRAAPQQPHAANELKQKP
jgi:hypothetical protein